jgi:uncharacterized cupredoxin-like copper-binding protein
MSDFQFYVLGSLIVVTLISLILSIRYKSQFHQMQGMVISMFLGMNIGLTAGVLMGNVYQGNLFYSTIISMAIGILAGSLCGLVFGILSWLEGLMAGLMGGMMGAMLGEMITTNQSLVIIKILLTLSISSIFLFFILKQPVSKDSGKRTWFLKPLITFILVVSYLIGGEYLQSESGDLIIMDSPSNHNQHGIKFNESKSPIINIETSDMTYFPSSLDVEKGKPVTLVFSNKDQINHDIEINSKSFEIINKTTNHQHDNSTSSLHLHAKPNSNETLTLIPMKEGTYEFYCTIPGHKESGMVGKMNVL